MSLLRKFDFVPEQKDAFGNNIFVNRQSVLDIKHIDSLNPQLISQLTSSGGSVQLNLNTASADMSVSSSLGAKVTRQTRYLPYQSGKSFIVKFTGVPFVGTIPADVKWQAGFFDDQEDKDAINYPNQYLPGNGLFFQYLNGWSFVNRTSTSGVQTDIPILQNNWNMDKLDGTGPSGFNLDATKNNIFWIDFGWLSIRGFRFGVYNGGEKIIAHDENKSNIMDAPYMTRATLPIKYKLEQLGNTPITSKMICCTAESFGGYSPTGVIHTINRGISTNSVPEGDTEALLVARLKQSYNRRSLNMVSASIISTSNANALIQIWINPTLNQEPGWQDVGAGSGVEFAIDLNENFSGGVLAASKYISNNNDAVNFEGGSQSVPSSNIEGKSDIIVISATSFGNSESYLASINFKEII